METLKYLVCTQGLQKNMKYHEASRLEMRAITGKEILESYPDKI